MQKYQGLPASEGIAIGPAWIYHPLHVTIDHHHVNDPVEEWERLQTALSLARTQLQALEERARTTAGAEEAAIFGAHQLFLDDVELLSILHTSIMDQAWNAEAAVQEGFEHYARALESLEDEYFKARAADVRDVERRVLRCLKGFDAEAESQLAGGGVLIVPDFIANAGGVICAAMEYHGATRAAAFEAIAGKLRDNTAAVLQAMKAKNQLPRAAALELALARVRKAMRLRRFKA